MMRLRDQCEEQPGPGTLKSPLIPSEEPASGNENPLCDFEAWAVSSATELQNEHQFTG